MLQYCDGFCCTSRIAIGTRVPSSLNPLLPPSLAFGISEWFYFCPQTRQHTSSFPLSYSHSSADP